jgi:glycosyltransferase involved in cell wall biosynthesis
VRIGFEHPGMNILHVVSSLDPALGGPPITAMRIAAAQAAMGNSVRILSYRNPQAQSRIEAEVKNIPHFSGVELAFAEHGGRAESLFARGAGRSVSSALGGTEILHLHGVWDRINFVAAKCAVEGKKPYVVTPHGMLDPWSLRQKRLKKMIALRMGYKRMLDGAAFLHFLNQDELRLTERLGLKPPARIVPNGVFPEEIEPLPERGMFRKEHPEFADAKLVLFLSRLHFKKGLDFLADAFAAIAPKFPDAHLVVAGPDDGAKQSFEEQVLRLGIAGRVHLVGPLYARQKLGALRDCDCFCLPSRQEGFSLAITEALACEAPVVISTECHFPEVREAGAGIVAELNAPAIAQAIANILRDPAAAQQMGKKGRELVLSRYTWPKVAEALVGYYREGIGGGKA